MMVDAAEYDVLPCVAPRPMVRLGVGRTRACGDVFGARAKSVRIVCVEAMRDGEAEEGRGDKAMAYGNGALHSWRGFVAIGRRAGYVGGVVGGVIVGEDLLPHRLFGWGVVVEKGKVPVVRSFGYLRPVIRSIGYLRLSAPVVRLFL
jgi:hypothetical protein